jgi:photosystem II stability/assembly factor-like uncharacterized protein
MRLRFQRARAGGLNVFAALAALAVGACAGPAPSDRQAPEPVARTSSAAGPATASYRLTGVAFTTATRGYGEFVSYPASRCRVAVAATTDGGARFSAPVMVATWRCATGAEPAGSLAFDVHGDGFLYGPKLFVTHDGGRAWVASHQPGQVLAVEADQRSVWMLQADCRHVDGPGRCPLRLLESADGGRTWTPAPSQPPAFASGYGGAVPAGAAQGQSWLARTGRSSGYVASLMPGPGMTRTAGLWFTSDGGRSWSRRRTPCTGMSAALSAAPGGVLFAVCASQPGAGQQGKTVARSADGGRSWTRPASCRLGACPWPLGFGYLGSIDAADAHTVYLVGDRSPLLVTTDGGSRWRTVTAITAGSDAGTSQVNFFGRSDGLVVGADNAPPHSEQPAIWRTSDGGARWSVVHPAIG